MKIRVSSLIILFLIPLYTSAQFVGIGEAAPDSKLDIVNASATGAALELNQTSAVNTSEALDVNNGGDGHGASIETSSTTNTESALIVTHAGEASVVEASLSTNTAAGSVSIGSFAYTGIQTIDHVGVNATVNPSFGWGIGVRGTGGYYGVQGTGGQYGVIGSGSSYGVFSVGSLGASGVKTFLIDHPQDPTNKKLRHFSVESNEVLNLYRGIIVLDNEGKGVVVLPDYFESLNTDFSYQLTAIGSSQQPWVITEINDNQFTVGGFPGSKVSWTVMANRNDPYMQQNPNLRAVEIEKVGAEQGRYIQPDVYNQPGSASIFDSAAKANSSFENN